MNFPKKTAQKRSPPKSSEIWKKVLRMAWNVEITNKNFLSPLKKARQTLGVFRGFGGLFTSWTNEGSFTHMHVVYLISNNSW